MEQTGATRSLEIDEDPAFERREWVIQRLGWAAMALFLLLAVLGFFGPGLLGSRTATSGALEARYSRFIRYQAGATLRLAVPADGGEARVTVDAAYLEAVNVERVSPEPERVEGVDGGQMFVFEAADVDHVEATFHLRPAQAGPVSGEVRAEGERVRISQFVYP